MGGHSRHPPGRKRLAQISVDDSGCEHGGDSPRSQPYRGTVTSTSESVRPTMIAKIQPCLWYDGNAEEASRFYADTFPNSRVGAVMRAPGDYPAGKKGDLLTVEMTILGMPFLLLNGGPQFTFDEAVSFQVATEDQAETDRYWKAIISDGGGQESACGWCKDRFGLSWQIT